MKLSIGTSGYSYAEWKGSFYPADLPASKMFAHYGERFSTVEINATFFRMPTDAMVAGWVQKAPAGFRYTLKAPKVFTYTRRLKDCAQPMEVFLRSVAKLGPHRAALLFHLPPYVEKDVPSLKDFLALVPADMRAAFEFRNPAWHDDQVFTALADAGAALAISDSESLTTPLVATTTWGYLRLRDEGYGPKDIARWRKQILAQKWDEAFVYFKHEDAGRGPQFAMQMKALEGVGRAAKSRR